MPSPACTPTKEGRLLGSHGEGRGSACAGLECPLGTRLSSAPLLPAQLAKHTGFLRPSQVGAHLRGNISLELEVQRRI